MSLLDYKLYYERNLPHYQSPGATLFITFRLAGSLPAHVLRELRAEAGRLEAAIEQHGTSQGRQQLRYQMQRRLFGRWDEALHVQESGPFWLREPGVAGLAADSMHYRDGRVYVLRAFCIMPNHVHIVFTPLAKPDGSYYAMSAIMHSLKLHIASEANALLGREGQFWQHESYDHEVRDEAELTRIIEYVLHNPVKAGLARAWQEWQWNYLSPMAG